MYNKKEFKDEKQQWKETKEEDMEFAKILPKVMKPIKIKIPL